MSAGAGPPLADLHRHLDGSLRPATLTALAAAAGAPLPADLPLQARPRARGRARARPLHAVAAPDAGHAAAFRR